MIYEYFAAKSMILIDKNYRGGGVLTAYHPNAAPKCKIPSHSKK